MFWDPCLVALSYLLLVGAFANVEEQVKLTYKHKEMISFFPYVVMFTLFCCYHVIMSEFSHCKHNSIPPALNSLVYVFIYTPGWKGALRE